MSQVQRKIQQDNRETIKTYNPATGDVHKTYYLHTQKEAEEIIEQAHEAFLEWRQTSFEKRADILNKVAEILERDKSALAEMMTKQMGKPIEQGEGEIDLCAAIAHYTAEQGPKVLEDEVRSLDEGSKGIISYEPVGVILGMQPWNFPFYQCMRYSMAVIMAGNSTVFKHAELCHETAERIQKIYEEAGLPEDVFSVLYVKNEVVDELIGHRKIRGVTFTGSAAAGKIVAEKAGKNLKKTVLELGGSDPYIVLADCNLDDVISTCVEGRINNGGQTCIAAKRFIIEEAIYDEFKKKFVEAMKNVKYGDPLDRDNDMGPLSSKERREDLHDQVQECVKKGAKILCGGEIPEGNGYYYPPTVLENIKPGMPAYDDELFGPVAGLFKVKDVEEAIKLANDHRYGLGGGVFSSDQERAIQIARRIDTGIVNVNGYALAQPNMPFGGVKESGYGREHGGFGLREFVNVKSILVS